MASLWLTNVFRLWVMFVLGKCSKIAHAEFEAFIAAKWIRTLDRPSALICLALECRSLIKRLTYKWIWCYKESRLVLWFAINSLADAKAQAFVAETFFSPGNRLCSHRTLLYKKGDRLNVIGLSEKNKVHVQTTNFSWIGSLFRHFSSSPISHTLT